MGTLGRLKNTGATVPSSVLVLIIVGFVSPDLWIYLFSIIMSYVISDVVLNLIIRGGRGIVQIPFESSEIQTKGHAYLAFLIGIVVATYLSSLFSDAILNSIRSYADWNYTVLVTSVAVGLVVFLDLEARFYKR